MMCPHARRTLTAAAACLVLAAPALAGPPSAVEIFDKSREALGGKAIDKMESYTASSEMTTPMGTMTVVVSWHKLGRVAIKQTMPQMGEMEMGTDGTIGWLNHPMMGYQLIEGNQLSELKQQAIHARILNLKKTMKEEQEKITGVAEAELDGVKCYEVSFESTAEDNPDKGSILFDAETGLIRAFRMIEERGGMPTEATLRLKDWKEIDGVKFFRQVDIDGGGVEMRITYNSIEPNSVKPEVFAVPAEVKELLK